MEKPRIKNFISGIILISYGFFILFAKMLTVQVTVALFLNLAIFYYLFTIISNIFQKKFSWTNIIIILILIALRFLNAYTFISTTILILFIGIYQLLLGIIYGITYFLYRKHSIPKRTRYLIDSIILVSFGLESIFNPFEENMEVQFLILGGYFILLGIRKIREAIFYYQDLNKTELKRHIRIHVPIIFEALIPGQAFTKFNELLNEGTNISQIENLNTNIDLEIFVHAMEGFQGATGHVDMCFNNEVISYGCYDTPTTRFFGTISDGTLIKCDRTEYLNFCQTYKDRVFAYGVSLNETQKKAIESKINELNSILIDWKLDIKKHQELNTQAYQLSQKTNTKFFKFKKSKFQTYFVATTNCALLADTIIGEMGSDILNVRGVITPGTYLNYLEQEYNKKHSFVVSKAVY